MPKNPQKINIIKIPLKGGYSVNKPQTFPHMSRLYLELLENKSKIRQELINKEYVPIPKIDNSSKQNVPPQSYNSYSPPESKDKSSQKLSKLTTKSLKSYNDSYDSQDKKFQDRLDLLLSDNNSNNSSISTPVKKHSSPSDSSLSELSIYEKKTIYTYHGTTK